MTIDKYFTINEHDVHIGTDADLRKVLTDNCGYELADYIVNEITNAKTEAEVFEDKYWAIYDENDELEGTVDELSDELDKVKDDMYHYINKFTKELRISKYPPTPDEILDAFKEIADKIKY